MAAFLADFLVAFGVGAFATFFAAFLETAFFERAFLETAFRAVAAAFLERALTLPTTTSDPMDGKMVDSSPPDHVTRSREPLTLVTTPSRGPGPPASTAPEPGHRLRPFHLLVFMVPTNNHRPPEAAGGIEPPYGALQAPA